jgi:WD40 repeat protein
MGPVGAGEPCQDDRLSSNVLKALQTSCWSQALIHQVAWCVCVQNLEAKTTYVAHQGVVEDVAWHQHHTDIFGSVGDDKQLILWDTRKPPRDGEQACRPHSRRWAMCLA